MILFRVKTRLVAIAKSEQGRMSIVTVEAGSIVRTLGIDKALPVSGLIDVRINEGEVVSMFRQDLEQRGERINEESA